MMKNQSEAIQQLEKQIELEKNQSEEWNKKQKLLIFARIRNYLNECWRKQIIKHQGKYQKLAKELEVISSRK